jgi:hypothetical protein
MAKRKARRTPKRRNRPRTVGLVAFAEHTGTVLDSLLNSVESLSHGLDTLNGSLKVNIAGSHEAMRFLGSQLVALRDLLVRNGVITPEEAIAVAQIAELERILNAQSKIANGAKPPSRRRRPPGGGAEHGEAR